MGKNKRKRQENSPKKEEDDVEGGLGYFSEEGEEDEEREEMIGVDDETGVIYLGRIPRGFFEDQMRSFFSQFGSVLRLKLSRNKKTGRSRHYAFIEFEDQEIAEIVAETMNNYVLYGHKLICKAIPKEKRHPMMFKGSDKKFFKVPWKQISNDRHNEASSTPEKHAKRIDSLIQKEDSKRKRLKQLGIDYDFPGYRSIVDTTRSSKRK